VLCTAYAVPFAPPETGRKPLPIGGCWLPLDVVSLNECQGP
jgi:hypothetical protein